MKPFDLEIYKEDPSRELVTRDGHKARIICTDRIGDYPVIALVEDDAKEEVIVTYTELGHANHGHAEPLDLFFASVKHKGWINIYKDDRGVYYGQRIYDTEEKTRLSQVPGDGVAAIPIEWEE